MAPTSKNNSYTNLVATSFSHRLIHAEDTTNREGMILKLPSISWSTWSMGASCPGLTLSRSSKGKIRPFKITLRSVSKRTTPVSFSIWYRLISLNALRKYSAWTSLTSLPTTTSWNHCSTASRKPSMPLCQSARQAWKLLLHNRLNSVIITSSSGTERWRSVLEIRWCLIKISLSKLSKLNLALASSPWLATLGEATTSTVC